MKLLLLQARNPDDPMGAHEVQCFVDRCDVPPSTVVPHDLLGGPPTMEQVRQHDALLIGGSGDYYVSKGNLPKWPAFCDFLLELVAAGHPTFASCFGYQSIIHALGGSVINDPPNTEVGTFALELTGAGRDDPLLGQLPPSFLAQMGHKDRAATLPEGIDNLASSPRAPLQALRIPDKPIWATQFHPELDRKTNLERFDRYLEGYAKYMSAQEQATARAEFRESPGASALLRKFLTLI